MNTKLGIDRDANKTRVKNVIHSAVFQDHEKHLQDGETTTEHCNYHNLYTANGVSNAHFQINCERKNSNSDKSYFNKFSSI